MQSTKPMWTRIPLVTAQQRAKGLIGGEGGQWPRGLAISSDGNTLFLAIDVAGIYRSVDNGKSWMQTSVGYSPRGCSAIAMDPKNPDRVIAIGANSAPGDHHGPYLSTNRGRSWKSVLPVRMGGLGEWREQIAFDPSSYDPNLKGCRTIYWSRIGEDKSHWGEPINQPGIYRSDNGGENWIKIAGSEKFGNSIIGVNANVPGSIVVGNESGLHVSTDKGTTFKTLWKNRVTGLDLHDRQAFITSDQGLYRFTASAKTVNYEQTAVLNRPAPENYLPRDIKVSPANPDHLAFWTEPIPNNWDWRRYASTDGGKTWTQAKIDPEANFLPTNARQGLFAWNPKRASQVFTLGGDYVSVSNDSGKNFSWSSNGYNGVLVGGGFNFGATNPNVMMFGSQDYNAAMTTDNGGTWTYLNPSGNGWGGFCYGGYSPDGKTAWVGDAPGWGGKRRLKVSFDSGKTWNDTGLDFQGKDVSNSSPVKPMIGFASDLRTENGGKTWNRMSGCDAVTSFKPNGDPVGLKMLSDKKYQVISSQDHGKNWKVEATIDKELFDVAYDPSQNRYLLAAFGLYEFKSGVVKLIETPKDQFGQVMMRSVAIDPVDPKTIYVACNANLYNAFNSVSRSRDSGRTWTVLTRQGVLNADELDGGRETHWVRVHPKTREAWCATSCYGIWKVK